MKPFNKNIRIWFGPPWHVMPRPALVFAQLHLAWYGQAQQFGQGWRSLGGPSPASPLRPGTTYGHVIIVMFL